MGLVLHAGFARWKIAAAQDRSQNFCLNSEVIHAGSFHACDSASAIFGCCAISGCSCGLAAL